MIALFDIGSTLIEGPPYGPARRLAEMLALGKPGVPQLERLLFRTLSTCPEDLARHVAEATGIEFGRVADACSVLWNAQLEEAFVLPGAQDAVARLAAANIRRAYLSNIWPPFYEHFRRTYVSEAEAPQFLSFRMGLSKPSPEFFQAALRELGVEPKDVVMIGDTYANDIRPALELGMRAIWVLHRPDKEREALVEVLNRRAPAPHLTLRSIGDLQPEHIL